MLRWGTTFAKRCKAVTSTGGSQWLGSFWTPTTFKASLRKSPCSLNLGSHLPKPLKHNEKKDACSDKTCNSKKFINCKTDPKRDLVLSFGLHGFWKGLKDLNINTLQSTHLQPSRVRIIISSIKNMLPLCILRHSMPNICLGVCLFILFCVTKTHHINYSPNSRP